MKVLIVYGTRYGATENTATEIANVMSDEGFNIRVVNSRKEKIHDISEYDLIIVGSGLQMGRWVKDPEKFLKKFKDELAQKKLALFISSGEMSIQKAEGNSERIQEIYDKHLIDKPEKIGVNPMARGLFGGIWDYNKMGRIFRRMLKPFQMKLEDLGFKTVEEGKYDLRDMDAIRQWAKDLAEKART